MWQEVKMKRNYQGWLEDSVVRGDERAELLAVGRPTRHEIHVYDNQTNEQLEQYNFTPSFKDYINSTIGLGIVGFLIGGGISAGTIMGNNVFGNEIEPRTIATLGLITVITTLGLPVVSLGSGLIKRAYRNIFNEKIEQYDLHYPTEE